MMSSSETPLISVPKVLLAVVLAVCLTPWIHQWAETDQTIYALYLFLVSFLFCYLIMPLGIRLALRFHLVDKPDDGRKRHTRVTPLSGGIAIFTAFSAVILLNFHFSVEMKALLVAGTVIFFTGLIDDAVGLSARTRILIQTACALFLVFMGVRISFVPDSLGGIVTETIITMIWIIGITNSMNFIDGMDGLASGTSIIYTIFFAIVALFTRQPYMMFLAIIIAGSCAGFFPYNFRMKKPALSFLGDSGSTFLGFFLAGFAILGEWGDSILDITVPVLIMSVLIFDMTLTTVMRISTREVRSIGQWLHYTGRDHFHHRLAGLGLSNRRATILSFSVSLCFGLQALVVLFGTVLTSVLMLLQSVLLFVIFGIVLVLRKNHAAHSASDQQAAPHQTQ